MSYGAHKLFYVAILENGYYGLMPKKNIWDELPRHKGHVCKK